MEQKLHADKIKEKKLLLKIKFIHDNNINKFYCIMLLNLTKTDNVVSWLYESLPAITSVFKL